MKFPGLVNQVLEGSIPEEAPNKVFLYHGTTTGKAERFASEGIRVPRGTVLDYMMGLAKTMLDDLGYNIPVPAWMKMDFEEYIESVRINMSYISLNQDECIYTSLKYDTAFDYAYGLSKGDGEAYNNVYTTVRGWVNRPDNNPSGKEIKIPTLYPTGKPLVVGAKVPLSHTSIDPKDWANWYSVYRDDMKQNPSMAGTFDPFQIYYKNRSINNNYEIRVYKDIPPEDIFWGVTREAGGNLDDILRIAGI